MTIYNGTISINGTALSQQPSSLDESPTVVYSDQTSISGAKERQTFGTKKRAVLRWEKATPELVRGIIALATAGASVSYSNSNSAFYNGTNSFTGVLTISASEYVRGGSGLSSLEVIIEEGSGA